MALKVLIVDDSLQIRVLLKRYLERVGYQVEEAADGLEALEKMESFMPSLLLMDLYMPNMDGQTCLSEIRKERKWKFVPVIMLTAESDLYRIKAAQKIGANGWIVKPFNDVDIISMVKKFIP